MVDVNGVIIDRITSIIYYLYHEKMMNPYAMAGSYHIDDVFENACRLLLNISSEEFQQREKDAKNG